MFHLNLSIWFPCFKDKIVISDKVFVDSRIYVLVEEHSLKKLRRNLWSLKLKMHSMWRYKHLSINDESSNYINRHREGNSCISNFTQFFCIKTNEELLTNQKQFYQIIWLAPKIISWSKIFVSQVRNLYVSVVTCYRSNLIWEDSKENSLYRWLFN